VKFLWGGDALIKKIAHGLNITFERAERMKSYHGYVSSSEIELSSSHDQKAEHSNLNYIIRLHIQNLIKDIKKQLNQFDSSFYTNVAITGGLCELKGLKEYIEDSLCCKTSVLIPEDGFKISSFSTCFGAVKYGYYQLYKESKIGNLSFSKGLWQKIKNWFNEDL